MAGRFLLENVFISLGSGAAAFLADLGGSDFSFALTAFFCCATFLASLVFLALLPILILINEKVLWNRLGLLHNAPEIVAIRPMRNFNCLIGSLKLHF